MSMKLNVHFSAIKGNLEDGTETNGYTFMFQDTSDLIDLTINTLTGYFSDRWPSFYRQTYKVFLAGGTQEHKLTNGFMGFGFRDPGEEADFLLWISPHVKDSNTDYWMDLFSLDY